jgi:hypothetical protein
MTISDKLEIAKLVVSIFGFGGTIAALYFGFRQYRRSEQWKKSEFVAKEIKEFESDPVIRNALLMIDWGSRRVNLFLKTDPSKDDLIKITRETQCWALLPHTIEIDYLPGEANPSEVEGVSRRNFMGKFTPIEARIRDTYDIFLDRLERFANFIKSGLVDAEEFRPYLIYWTDSITNGTDHPGDVAWQCALLTYINYYNYPGVQYLFARFGKDITPDGKVYQKKKELMGDRALSDKLYQSVRR